VQSEGDTAVLEILEMIDPAQRRHIPQLLTRREVPC
jgi:hypothetical protein